MVFFMCTVLLLTCILSFLKSLHFILAQSGNFIITTACPLKFS